MAAEVTPDMVLQVTPVKRGTAERIAAYATARLAGDLPSDAHRAAGVSDVTAYRYELFLPVLCARFGLPEPRRSAPDFRVPAEGLGKGGHARWHVGRGVTSADCRYCRDGVR